MGHLVKIELTNNGLVVKLANHYTIHCVHLQRLEKAKNIEYLQQLQLFGWLNGISTFVGLSMSKSAEHI